MAVHSIPHQSIAYAITYITTTRMVQGWSSTDSYYPKDINIKLLLMTHMLGCADAIVVLTALALEYGLPYYIIRRPQIRTDISDKFANTTWNNLDLLIIKKFAQNF